jgi:hypothetical protein
MAAHGRSVALLAFLLVLSITGCRSAYYAAWESMGKEKRHLLKDEVENARTDQQEASEQFQDVLTRIKEMYGFEGGDIEAFYDNLKADYDECENRAETVRKRIRNVDQIAADLFDEWEREIEEIANARLRSKSEQSLEETRMRYARLHKSMTKAEASMEPVLVHLHDYVLYLKHNLNAQAIGALKQEASDIELEVQRLLADMNKSIHEAEDFLESFE